VEIVRSVAQHRVRTAVTVVGVALGVLALTVTGAMAEHFTAQLHGSVAYFRSSIQVVDDASSYAGVVSLTRVDAIQRVPGVAATLPSISVLARPGAVPDPSLALPETVGYVDPRELDHGAPRTALAAGRRLAPNQQGEVVLGSELAAALGARVGDTVALPVRPRSPNPDFVNHPFRVVGVLRPTDTIPDTRAEVSLLDAQLLLQESLPASFRDQVDPSSLATAITVYGKPGVDLDQLADRINASVPGVAATRPSDLVRGFDQGGRFTAIAAGTAVLALVLGGLPLFGTMHLAIAEREREIGLKLALGARGWQVGAEHLAEALALGLAGGLTGLVAGVGLAALLDLAGRSVGMDVFLVTGRLAQVGLGLAVGLGAGAGAVAARRAARLDPDVALRAR
jgi:putative ABC transport system permease protein